MGLQAGEGLQFATSFNWDLNEATRSWALRFKERHGRMPSMVHANTYTAVTHYLKAVAAAGVDDGDAVMAKFKATPIGTDALIQNASILPNGR